MEEYYDAFLVDSDVTILSLDSWIDRIRQKIRQAWHETNDRPMKIIVDVSNTAISTAFFNLRINMLEEEKIDFELEVDLPNIEITDPELLRLLEETK